MRRTLLLTVALSVVAAWPAGAQNLKVEFHDGRVSVDATSVPVRTILTEWGKIGGTKIVGADRISGAPITVKLINVTEAQALETILRSVAGYMAAPRNSGDGASTYDRIMVMATSSVPPPPPTANARPAQQPSTAFNGTQRFVPPRQRPEQAEPEERDEPDENPPNPPVFTFPQQGQPGFVNQPGQFQNAQPNGTFNPGTIPNSAPPATAPATTPAQPRAPFGVSQPGMMVQPPTTPPPTTTTPTPGMIRPPGGRNQ
jgi:hypothetical protein